MYYQGPLMSEPQYICDVCGRKKPTSQMAGKCSSCGKFVCSNCGRVKNDRVYCQKHVPSCFIATAAYGTSMSTEINVLREYRNDKLLTKHLGRSLVNLYYTLSPPIAKIISRSKQMRRIVRANLQPIVRFYKKKKIQK